MRSAVMFGAVLTIATIQSSQAFETGKWSGHWDGRWPSTITIERIEGTNIFGEYCFRADCYSYAGTIDGTSFKFNWGRAKFTFTESSVDLIGERLAGIYTNKVVFTRNK